jgi:hypothetical protein
MNQLYIDGNYILVIKGETSLPLEYPCGKSVYSEDLTNITIFEDGRGTLVIPKSEVDAGDWENNLAVAYTQETLLTFLRSNTGFNLPSNGGGGLTSVNYSTVAFVDNIAGDDDTAIIGIFDKPFFSIEGALNAISNTGPTSTNRGLVWIRKGEYSSVQPNPYNNCDVYCDAGVVFSGYFYLTDAFVGATNFNWYGHAKWSLGMGSMAFRIQNASTILIEGDSFVNLGAIGLHYNVSIGTSNVTYNFNSMESTQTSGSGYAFTNRNNCNVTFNVKNYMKSPHSMFDNRANHSGKIIINCPNIVMTAINIYGGNFKMIVYGSSTSITSETIINGNLYNEAPTYLAGLSSMIFIQGLGSVVVNGKIYSGQTIGTYNPGSAKIIVEGSIYSDITCFINNGSGDSFFRNGIMVVSALSIYRVGFISGSGKVWMQNISLKNEMVIGNILQQDSNTSKLFLVSVTSDGADTTGYFVNGTVAGIVNQFVNCVSNLPLNANVVNELAQGLIIDTLIKTPKF